MRFNFRHNRLDDNDFGVTFFIYTRSPLVVENVCKRICTRVYIVWRQREAFDVRATIDIRVTIVLTTNASRQTLFDV